MNPAEQNYIISEKKMMIVVQTVKEWRKYLEESTIENKVITDHKNLTYFKKAWITNHRQARWALEIQDIPFKLEYRKGMDNIVADALIRKENGKKPMQDRTIFLQAISLERAKQEGYHSLMEVSELERKGDQWLYRGRQVIEQPEEQQKIIRRCHDDERAGHPGPRETLRQMAEIGFWDFIRKDVIKYV